MSLQGGIRVAHLQAFATAGMAGKGPPSPADHIDRELHLDRLMRPSTTDRLSLGGWHAAGWKRCGGFTLAEVLVAILVLAAGLAMAANLLLRSNQTAGRSRELTAATLVARAQLDRLMKAPFAELISADFERNGKSKQGPVTFRWEAELEEMDEGLVRVRLIVAWQSRGGLSQREFTCIRSKQRT